MSLPHGAVSWSEVSERAFTSYTQLLYITADNFIFLIRSTSQAVSLKVD